MIFEVLRQFNPKYQIMATSIHTSIEINASPAQVWALLTDFDRYSEWNPFIKKIEGEIAVGNRFQAEIGNMKFKPVVLAFEKEKVFEWLGHLLIPGVIFDGQHKFELITNPDGTTTLHHSEKFTGILVPLMKKMLNNDTRAGFEAMNVALKKRAEGKM